MSLNAPSALQGFPPRIETEFCAAFACSSLRLRPSVPSLRSPPSLNDSQLPGCTRPPKGPKPATEVTAMMTESQQVEVFIDEPLLYSTRDPGEPFAAKPVCRTAAPAGQLLFFLMPHTSAWRDWFDTRPHRLVASRQR